MRLRAIHRALLVFVAASAGACTTSHMTPAMIAYGSNQPTIAPPPTDPDQPGFVRPGQPFSCVPYARQASGIGLVGDAYTWWDQAEGRYAREAMPRSGTLLVLVNYAGPKRAHLAYVTRIVSSREIRIDHANWLNDGNIYLNSPVIDVSAANDWTEVRVWNNRDGHMGIKTYNVRGFITPFQIAALPPFS